MPTPTDDARDPHSHAEIELEPPERLAAWAHHLGVTTGALQGAAKAVGRRVDRIKDHLTGGGAGGQSDG